MLQPRSTKVLWRFAGFKHEIVSFFGGHAANDWASNQVPLSRLLHWTVP